MIDHPGTDAITYSHVVVAKCPTIYAPLYSFVILYKMLPGGWLLPRVLQVLYRIIRLIEAEDRCVLLYT